MRRRRSQVAFSLFPFLSILICVIGTLALVIAALALRQVASEVAGRESQLDHDRSASLARADGARADARRAALERIQRRVAVLRQVLRERALDPDAPPDEIAKLVAARSAEAQAKERVPQLEREAAELERALATANAQVEALGASTKADPSRIALQPSGSGVALVPYFVECRRDGLLVHAHDDGWSQPLRLDDPVDSAQFTRFLRRARTLEDSTIIFLIRPSGVGTYRSASQRAREANVRHGKLPLPGNGAIDFSLL